MLETVSNSMNWHIPPKGIDATTNDAFGAFWQALKPTHGSYPTWASVFDQGQIQQAKDALTHLFNKGKKVAFQPPSVIELTEPFQAICSLIPPFFPLR